MRAVLNSTGWGLAILMVLEVHFGLTLIPLEAIGLGELWRVALLGWSGVDLFFVLSGFLLGGVLMDNRGASNYFRVFYTRRVARIFPAYYVIVGALLLAALPPVGLGTDSFRASLPVWSYLTYTQNLVMAAEGQLGSIWLAPTWSVAVEEQFYLLVPLLIWLVSRRALPYVLTAMLIACPIARMGLFALSPDADTAAGVLLPFRADPILFGLLSAWAIRDPRWNRLLHAHRWLLYTALVSLTVLSVLLALRHPYPTEDGVLFPRILGFTLLAALFASALLIAVTERSGPVTLVTRSRPLRNLGMIAYGTYLLHLPIKGLTTWAIVGEPRFDFPDDRDLYLVNLLALGVTLILAAISWLCFERRIRDWGRSFRYAAPGVAPSASRASG